MVFSEDVRLMPREKRTPTSMALSVAGAAMADFSILKPDRPRNDPTELHELTPEEMIDRMPMLALFVAVMLTPGADGDELARDYLCPAGWHLISSFDGQWPTPLQIIFAYVMQAVRADERGEERQAWTYVADAMKVLSVVKGEIASRPANHASELAHRRHAENRDMAEFAMKYWRENIDPNLSASKAASELVAARVVKLEHRTLAALVSKEKKKQPE